MGFLLFILSVILRTVMYPLAFVASVVNGFRKNSFRVAMDKLNQQALDIAISNDINGNVICDDLFNYIWIKSDGYQFGNRKETISSVLGKNQLAHSLSWFGWLIAGLLDLIDKGHCFKSIDNRV